LSNVDLAWGTFAIGRELFLALWGLSFLAAGLYLLGVFDLFAKGAKWAVGRGRLITGVCMLLVTAYLYSGLSGRRLGANMEAFLPILPDAHRGYSDGFLAVVSEDYEKGVALAQERNAPIFLHFTGFQ